MTDTPTQRGLPARTSVSHPLRTDPTPTDRKPASQADDTHRSGTADLDWFERLTGFRETDFSYREVQERLAVEGDMLVSRVNGRRHGIGRLELASLQTLRDRAPAGSGRRTSVRCRAGDARALHADPALSGALFQVASQFNLLEMMSSSVTPEEGVTGYARDHTQGPACAIAAGAATIFRNYFVPVGDALGQTADRQIDALAPLGEALSALLARPVRSLWEMRNGYALGTADGLAAIGQLLREASPATLDHLRGLLEIGLHWHVEVTEVEGPRRPRVSQAFCSALPIGYTRVAPSVWEPFARLVLDATFEATLRAGAELHHQGGSATVLLTRVGGGVFRNDDGWIDDAIERALKLVEFTGLDVRLVSFDSVHPAMRAIEQRWR